MLIPWKDSEQEKKLPNTDKSLDLVNNLNIPFKFEKKSFRIDSTWWKQVMAHTEWKIPVLMNGDFKNGDVIEYLPWGSLDTRSWKQVFLDYDKFVGYVSKEKGCSPEEVPAEYLMTPDEFSEKMSKLKKKDLDTFSWSLIESPEEELIYEYNIPYFIKTNGWIYKEPRSIYFWLAGGKIGFISPSRWNIEDIEPSYKGTRWVAGLLLEKD